MLRLHGVSVGTSSRTTLLLALDPHQIEVKQRTDEKANTTDDEGHIETGGEILNSAHQLNHKNAARTNEQRTHSPVVQLTMLFPGTSMSTQERC